MKSTICDIERLALHDGPGIRTVVFFKGCPLRCLWCSNPETFNSKVELYFNKNRCMQCQLCIASCPKKAITFDETLKIDRNLCNSCGNCTIVCPYNALNLVGKSLTLDAILKEILKDSQFFQNSQGGVTVSGGEILLQAESVSALLQRCKEEYIHTAIETSAYGTRENLEKIIRYTDYIMVDIKHMNAEKHKRLTGVDNTLILSNIAYLATLKKPLVIRVPLLHGINDDRDNIQALCDFVKENSIREIHLLPYHELGRDKYNQLNLDYTLTKTYSMDKHAIESIKKLIETQNIKCIVGG